MPALLVALGTATLLVVAVRGVLEVATSYWSEESAIPAPELMRYIWPTWVAPAAIIVLGALAVLATIITAATSSVTARERATREALGVTAAQTRAGAAVAHGTALVIGVVVGFGFAVVIFFAMLAFDPAPGITSDTWGYVTTTAIVRAVVTVLGTAVVLTVLSSLAVSAVARTPSLAPRTVEAGRVS